MKTVTVTFKRGEDFEDKIYGPESESRAERRVDALFQLHGGAAKLCDVTQIEPFGNWIVDASKFYGHPKASKRRAMRCHMNERPCERRQNSSDNTCAHYPEMQ